MEMHIRNRPYLRLGTLSDAEIISSLYTEVLITPENLHDKLNYDNRDNFKNTGGLFDAISPDDIRKRMNGGFVYIVSTYLENEIEKINACFALRSDIVEFDGAVWDFEDPSVKNDFIMAVDRKKVFTVSEGIISKKFQGTGVVYSLFYEAYTKYMSMGYKYIAFQIYNITGMYDNDDVYTPIDMPHQKSIKMTRNQGAIKIGKKSIPLQAVGDKKIEISSFIYTINLESAISYLSGVINQGAQKQQSLIK